ncbi:hypothetical protein [Nostoc sp.]
MTIFKATAAPIPILLEPSTAVPSAIAEASVSFDVASLNSPGVLMTNPSAKEACVLEVAIFSANPAAIDTEPSLVLALPLIAP